MSTSAGRPPGGPSATTRLKQVLKRRLPPRLFVTAKRVSVIAPLLRAYRYDLARYGRFSSTVTATHHRENLRALITERYHGIEKGLSLPAPRPGFGRQPVGELVDHLHRYLDRFGLDELAGFGLGALSKYVAFNEAAGLAPADIPHRDAIEALVARSGLDDFARSGTTTVTRSSVHEAVEHVDLDFFASRRSTRQFSTEPVEHSDIEFAASVARTAPAVCNRQFGRIRVWKDTSTIARLLEIQGGAKGFAHQVPALAMITVSQRNYWSPAERNQGWIDGGMFAMNFLLGLHARQLGAVALNWSKEPATDARMRAAVDLADDESIIMLVAFGHLRERYQVAASPRRDLRDVLTVDT